MKKLKYKKRIIHSNKMFRKQLTFQLSDYFIWFELFTNMSTRTQISEPSNWLVR